MPTTQTFAKSGIVKAAAAVTLSFASSAVLAAPMFDFLDIRTRSGFIDFAPDPGVTGSIAAGGLLGGPFDDPWRRLEWGVGDDDGPSSALQVNNRRRTMEINGDAQNVGVIRHENFPIFGASLTDATLLTQLQLNTAPPLDTPSWALIDGLTFAINFQETPNAADPCANGLDNGDGVNVNGCGDIFTIDVAGAGFNDDLELVQTLDALNALDPDYVYTATLTIAGLGELSDESCAAAGVDAGCIGFETEENATTRVSTSLIINATAVPAPATLALMGLGLLAVARRSKKS